MKQRLIKMLDRWERAYTGYALIGVHSKSQREKMCKTGFQKKASDEDIGMLIRETRNLLKISRNE